MFGRRFNFLSVFGIKIGIDFSWFLIAILLAWSLAAGYFPYYYPKLAPGTYWAMGIAGMLGLFILLFLYAFVVGRAIYLSTQTQDTYARLLAGSLALTFFVYVFINAGMVSGLLPVVGVPLPLVSYGGTSMVTLLAGFGILMSMYSHRKLIGS